MELYINLIKKFWFKSVVIQHFLYNVAGSVILEKISILNNNFRFFLLANRIISPSIHSESEPLNNNN